MCGVLLPSTVQNLCQGGLAKVNDRIVHWCNGWYIGVNECYIYDQSVPRAWVQAYVTLLIHLFMFNKTMFFQFTLDQTLQKGAGIYNSWLPGSGIDAIWGCGSRCELKVCVNYKSVFYSTIKVLIKIKQLLQLVIQKQKLTAYNFFFLCPHNEFILACFFDFKKLHKQADIMNVLNYAFSSWMIKN